MLICERCGGQNPPDGRFCSYCGVTLSAPDRALVRRTVTLVFVDLIGSTELGERLDPEALTTVLRDYFDIARSTVERHGGTIMKFIGDAVVAVFGLPVSHEDDAVRAVRATSELLARVEEHNEDLSAQRGVRLRLRAGINTGEVAADGNAIDESFVFGDTANTAARLEQHAPEARILVGASTIEAAGAAVDASEVASIDAKGKAAPVRAFLIDGVAESSDSSRRQSTAPLVGRHHEMTALRAAFDRSKHDGVQTVVLVGEPGLGKTRLAHELIEVATQAEDNARCLVGRCPPYGEQITYWPIREMATQLVGLESTAAAGDLHERLLQIGSDTAVQQAVGKLAAGLDLVEARVSSGEMVWGVETITRYLGVERPVVVLIDDIQWAGPELLTLVGHLATALTDVPLLILATARPEFLDEHTKWVQDANGSVLTLEPLDSTYSTELIDQLLSGLRLDEPIARSVRERAGGNPLFIEHVVDMLRDQQFIEAAGGVMFDTGRDPAAVPATLQSLIGARLERLSPLELDVISAAAVFGADFNLDDLSTIVSSRSTAEIEVAVERLSNRGYLDADSTAGPGRVAFRHLLVRETAYERLPRAERATIHIRAVGRLESAEQDHQIELDEAIGYHLERAHDHLSDLGELTDDHAGLATAAVERLGRAGRRASRRGDVLSAARLLGRACELVGDDPIRPRLLVDLGAAHVDAGSFEAASAAFDRAADDPARDDDTVLLLDVCRHQAQLQVDSAGSWLHKAHEDAQRALDHFVEIEDRPAVERVGWFVLLTSVVLGQATAGKRAVARLRATSSGSNGALTGRLSALYAMHLAWGPTPAAEALAEVEQILVDTEADPSAEPIVLAHHAQLLSIVGRREEALATLDRARDLLELQGQRLLQWAAWSQGVGRIELASGRPDRAEAAMRLGYDALVALGERGYSSTLAGQLAHAVIDQGRHGEAAALIEACRRDAGDADALSQILWRTARARVLADNPTATSEEAVALVEEALVCAGSTEWPTVIGQTMLVASSVLHRVEADHGRATRLVDDAIAIFRSKGNTVGVTRATSAARTQPS